MIKNIIFFVAVSVFVISLTIFTREVLAEDESGEIITSTESISAPEPDVPAAQDAQDEKRPSLVISATRYEMPQSQVSSNITVITKEDISHLPVHDVAEALIYTTGITINNGGGPGTASAPSIQGSDFRHVKLMVDGVPLENFSEGFPDLTLISLDSVERIEILKGSASSVWGSSLGGVINIITKGPAEKAQAEGGISVGENSTKRYNASLSGRIKDTGYYLSFNRFETNGFHAYQKAKNNYFYAKVTENLTPTLKGELSYGYTGIDRQDSGWIATELTFEHRGRIMLTYTPKEEYELSLSAYDRLIDFRSTDITTDTLNLRDRQNAYGGNLRSVWRHSKDSAFSVSVEGEHGHFEETMAAVENFDVEKGALLANENLGLGDLTLNIGGRYDSNSAFGSEVSPSAGAVYRIAGNTLFRISAARGFTPPPLPWRYQGLTPNTDLHAERAWSYQAGLESDVVPGISEKVTFFRADITDLATWKRDVNDINGNGNLSEIVTFINLNNVRREGVEVEVKTQEYKGLRLSYGYAFNDVTDQQTGQTVSGQARITHAVGVDYKGPMEIRATLNGHYVWWNADPSADARDKTLVLDTKVSKYFARWKYVTGECFVAVYNITDQHQYSYFAYPNPPRWVEVGINLTTF